MRKCRFVPGCIQQGDGGENDPVLAVILWVEVAGIRNLQHQGCAVHSHIQQNPVFPTGAEIIATEGSEPDRYSQPAGSRRGGEGDTQAADPDVPRQSDYGLLLNPPVGMNPLCPGEGFAGCAFLQYPEKIGSFMLQREGCEPALAPLHQIMAELTH